MVIENKSFSFEVKEVDEKESRFEGYSAGIGNEDLGRDVIEPGAFKKTIQERIKSRNVKLLDNHSRASTKNVWGTAVDAEEIKMEHSDPDGPSHKLWTEFEVSKTDPDAQSALGKIREKHLNQLSIGYKPIKVDFTIDDDSSVKDDPTYAWLIGEATRNIKELAWWETSIVIWGMNPEATIVENSVKTIQHFAKIAKKNKEQIPQRYVDAAIGAMNSLIDLDIHSDQLDKVKNVVSTLEKYTTNLKNIENSIFTQLINEYKDSQEHPSREHFFIWFTDNVKENEEFTFEKDVASEDAPENEKEENTTSSIDEVQSESDVTDSNEDQIDLRAISDRLTELSAVVESLIGEDSAEDEDAKEAAVESTSPEAAESTSDDAEEKNTESEKDDSESLKIALELADMELTF